MSHARWVLFLCIVGTLGLALTLPGLSRDGVAVARPALQVGQQVFLPFVARNRSGPPLELSISPQSVASGGQFTATGTGFTPNSPVPLSLITPGGAEIMLSDQPPIADANGSFNTTVQLPTTIGLPPGTYQVQALDVATNESVRASLEITGARVLQLGQPFQQSQSIDLSVTPYAAPAGTRLTVHGSGFTPLSPIRRWFLTPTGLRFDIFPAYLMADAAGQFAETFALPSTFAWPVGIYSYYALDMTASRSGTASFVVTAEPVGPSGGPSLDIQPRSGQAGTVFSAGGFGFTPFGMIEHWLVGPNGTRIDFATRFFNVSASGEYRVMFYLTGLVPPGTYTYYARDGTTGATGSAAFSITGVSGTPQPTITPTPTPTPLAGPGAEASPPAGSIGTRFVVSGYGFTSRGSIRHWLIDPNGGRVGFYPDPIPTDGSGRFMISFAFPPGPWPVGLYVYHARDESTGLEATTGFTLGNAGPAATATPPVEPTLTISPAVAFAGIELTATGRRFTPGGVVENWLLGPSSQRYEVAPSSLRADAQGSFTVTFSLSSTLPSGTYTYNAHDVSAGKTVTVAFELISGPAASPKSWPPDEETPGGPKASAPPASSTVTISVNTTRPEEASSGQKDGARGPNSGVTRAIVTRIQP